MRTQVSGASLAFPIRSGWQLTADWKQRRPWKAPPESQHVHGAWDLAASAGTPILSPERGRLHYLVQFRKEGLKSHNLYWDDRKWYAFSNYFYDVWGGVAVLEAESGLTYLFAHLWAAELIQRMGPEVAGAASEWAAQEGLGAVVLWTGPWPLEVQAGQVIAHVGNAGFSTGAHLHLECHFKRDWLSHERRPDPADLWPAQAKVRVG